MAKRIVISYTLCYMICSGSKSIDATIYKVVKSTMFRHTINIQHLEKGNLIFINLFM